MKIRVVEAGFNNVEPMAVSSRRFCLRRLRLCVGSRRFCVPGTTVGCALIMALMMFVGCDAGAESKSGEAVAESERAQDSSGEEQEKTEDSTDEVEQALESNADESDAEEVSGEEDESETAEERMIDVFEGADAETLKRNALEAHREGDSGTRIDELDNIGDWAFYEYTEPTLCVDGLVSVFAVYDDDIIDDGGSEELGRLYEFLNLFDAEDLPKDKTLSAAQYLVSHTSREDIIMSTDDELAERARRHFPDIEMEAPQFQRQDDEMTIRYFTVTTDGSGCVDTPNPRLRRYEITVTKNYDVEVVSISDEYEMDMSVDIPGDDVDRETVKSSLLRAQGGGWRRCFERELMKNPEARGQIDLELFDIDERWWIMDSRVVSDDVGGDVGDCIAEEWKRVRVRMPEDYKPVEVVVTYEFSPAERSSR